MLGTRKKLASEARRGSEAPRFIALLQNKRLHIAVGAVLGVTVFAWLVLLLLDRPVQRVEVAGQFHRVSPLQVEQAVLPFTHTGFVSVELDKIKAAVESIPWVDRARVERSWPGGVAVFVNEQIPGARWGERGLLNSRGELFLKEARFIPAELPRLDGPDGTETQVARLYLDTYPRLTSVGLRLSRVSLDPRGAWQLTVTSAQNTVVNVGGVTVRLGRLEVEERLERFIRAASPVVASQADNVAYVDMRYSNGFAVGWLPGKSPSSTQDGGPARVAVVGAPTQDRNET
jgi:cell division protein FtsQ